MENTDRDNKWLTIQQRKRAYEKAIDEQLTGKERNAYLLLVMLLAVVYYIFFNNRRAGISLFVFLAMVLWVFFYINKNSINIKNKTGLFALACLLVICIGNLLHCNSVAEELNRVAVPMLITGAFIMFRYPDTRWGDWSFIGMVLERIVIIPFRYISKPFQIIRYTKHSTASMDKSKSSSILKGLLIGIPTLLVVMVLLSSADVMYGYYLSNLGRFIRIENAGDVVRPAISIQVLFILFFSYLYSFKYNANDSCVRKAKAARYDRVMCITLLVPLVVAYAGFIAIQLYYLFGREGLPNGFTYAEYARQGFFQLLIVTAINFVITSLIASSYRKAGAKLDMLLKVLLSIIALCTFFMLYSSSYKLSLYEQGYGFTYLRFYVHCFIIMLFLLMGIMLAGIWFPRIDIVKSCFICAIGFYCLLTLVSPDRFIAEQNLRRYEVTGKIDTEYMERLSADAVPYVREYLEDKGDSQLNGLRTWIYDQERKAEEYKWYEMNLPLYKLSKANN